MGEETGAARAMKRRGLIAGAAALVAGLMAKRASESVAASGGLGADGPLVLGSNDDSGNSANYTNARTQVISGLGNPTGNGFRGKVLFDCSASPFQSSGDANVVGISGVSRGSAAGVYGADTTNKPSGFPAEMNAGVYGYAYNQGHSGVHGDGGSFGIGVSGVSFNSNALLGSTLSSIYNTNAAMLGLGYGIGVQGSVPSGGSQANTIAVYGLNQSSSANGIGVYGVSANGTGVFGQTVASYQYGVLGQTFEVNSTAVAGTCTGNGSSAFSGGTGNANAFAAYFQGHVQIDGPFDVIGAGNKHAAVAHPDGSHRTIYSIEAPEAWVEDFGTGTLTAGQASVKLDPDFAALTHTEDYHVFLTEYADHHLHVSQRTAAGFTVEADTALAALKGKKVADLGGTFSWRVVARPKTTAKVGRLAKVTIADAKALLPDPAKLPKPPETPAVPKKP